MARTTAARLSRDAWAQAALEALAERGLAGVAVEPLAARLGTTKGSFYWHFKDRRALLEAALERWEAETAAIIAAVEAVPGTPTDRLGAIFTRAYRDVGRSVDAALLAEAADPLVAAALERVTRARLAFLEELYVQAGTGNAARSRALEAYTAFLGLLALERAAPAAAPHGDELAAHLAALTARHAP